MIRAGIAVQKIAHDHATRRKFAKIKAAGFDYVIAAYHGFGQAGEILRAWREDALAAGLSVEAVYLPSEDLNEIWRPGEEGDAVTSELEGRIFDVSRAGIGTVILQAALEMPPPVAQCGLDRFRRLSRFAEERGVAVCLENRKNLMHFDVLCAVLSHCHGLCWNAAHNRFFTPKVDFLENYARRLHIAVLEDGRETEEGRVMHLLPGEGDLDLAAVARGLARADYRGVYYVNAERKEGQAREEFYAASYDAARRVSLLVDACREEV